MKKLMFIAAAVCTVCILGSCSKSTGSKKNLIGLSVSTQNNPFFVTLADGARKQAEVSGCELSIVDAGDDVVKQTSDIEDLVSKKIKVLIVNPVDSSAIAPAVTAAKKAGIPVIAVDRTVIGETVTCQIASDNVAGAKMAGEYLLSLVGDGAEIAELQGVPGASATIDRGKGFHEAVDGKAKIVASLTANFNRVEGMSVTENILQGNNDIKGIFAHNDEMALGAVEAAASAGKKIVIVGFDATDDAVAAVKEGRMAATVAQQPGEMGKVAVETALKIINGESVPSSLPVIVSLITK
ncbi:MAG TPA: D-ribose ABC transporter substrate-binding protein [Treponema sp.]|nr:D-ribose ABC transporter substrate-binding protein [Treponema sp.]